MVDNFREVMGNFATGVNVVTFPKAQHGLTANAFSSVSLDPPLVLVCVDHGTHSYELLDQNEVNEFCINILSAEQQYLGEYFADIIELEDNPFDTEPTRPAPSQSPIFENSLGYADCQVWKEVPAGDHTIYIGEVEEAAVLNDDADALTFFRGEWGQLS